MWKETTFEMMNFNGNLQNFILIGSLLFYGDYSEPVIAIVKVNRGEHFTLKY